MSTFSNLKFELIGTGEQSGYWGNTTNTNIGTAIEQAIVGMATLTSANFTSNIATLTLTNTNTAQNARAFCLVISAGSLSAAGTLNVPEIQKPYLIINSDSYAITVKVSGMTGVSVPAGARTILYNNGTDVGNQISYLSSLALGTALPISSGGTGTTSTTFVDLTTNVTGALPVANGGTGATTANAALNNLQGYTTTATAAGTTTLTAASTYKQYFTGTTTQTVVMPVVTTLALGRSYEIVNNSTGILTVNSSGGNLITTIPAGISGVVTCIAITGTTAASWHYEYSSFDAITGTGSAVFSTTPTFTNYATVDGVTSSYVRLFVNGVSIGEILANATGLQLNSVTAQPAVIRTNSTDRVSVDSSGNMYIMTGALWQYAPAPTSKAAVATLTAAELLAGILSTTGTSYTVTVPTGTAIDAAVTQVPALNVGFDLSVVNTASGTITMAVNTGVTSLGSLTIATGTSAQFRFRRTAANTYVMYRIA